MEKLFGVPLPTLMFILSGIFVATMLVVIAMAVRNPVMLKLGIRPISRRPGMTALIIIGVMLSTIIISAAFGTADTLSYSIRDIGINGLGTIDEIVISARAQEGDQFGQSFISMERFEELRSELAADDRIDGIMPQFTQNVPAVNPVEDLSEGQLNLLGIDPALLGGFGGMKLASGGNADLQSLRPNETFINEDASEELDLQSGGELEVYVEDGGERFVVKGVLEDGGFAGISPTMIISLERAQEMFDRTGQITSIIISNRGDQLTGNELSEEVTKDLRVKFTDRETASRLKDLLNDDVFLTALELERDTAVGDDKKEELTKLLDGIRAPELTDDLAGRRRDFRRCAEYPRFGRHARSPARGDHALQRARRNVRPGYQVRHPQRRGAGRHRHKRLLPDLQHVLDSQRHPPDFPHFRPARRREEVGDGHGPGRGGQTSESHRDVRVRGDRLRPRVGRHRCHPWTCR